MGLDNETLSLGVGLKSGMPGLTYTVDYDFSLLGDLGISHRVSLGVKFTDGEETGQIKGQKGGIRKVKLKDNIKTRR